LSFPFPSEISPFLFPFPKKLQLTAAVHSKRLCFFPVKGKRRSYGCFVSFPFLISFFWPVAGGNFFAAHPDFARNEAGPPASHDRCSCSSNFSPFLGPLQNPSVAHRDIFPLCSLYFLLRVGHPFSRFFKLSSISSVLFVFLFSPSIR